MCGETHFVQRWNERGDGSECGKALMLRLRLEHKQGALQHVMDQPEGGAIYRFISEGGGVFYTVFAHEWPKTVLLQKTIKRKKQARRRAKRFPQRYAEFAPHVLPRR